MKSLREPNLELRGELIRSLGSLREMLPGSFVERKRACGRPNCHCAADGKRVHSQHQISVLVDGKPKALNVPAELAGNVREKIDMRHRFDAAAATICRLNLKRFIKERKTARFDAEVFTAVCALRAKAYGAFSWVPPCRFPA